jgi:hypothetical protein
MLLDRNKYNPIQLLIMKKFLDRQVLVVNSAPRDTAVTEQPKRALRSHEINFLLIFDNMQKAPHNYKPMF